MPSQPSTVTFKPICYFVSGCQTFAYTDANFQIRCHHLHKPLLFQTTVIKSRVFLKLTWHMTGTMHVCFMTHTDTLHFHPHPLNLAWKWKHQNVTATHTHTHLTDWERPRTRCLSSFSSSLPCCWVLCVPRTSQSSLTTNSWLLSFSIWLSMTAPLSSSLFDLRQYTVT